MQNMKELSCEAEVYGVATCSCLHAAVVRILKFIILLHC